MSAYENMFAQIDAAANERARQHDDDYLGDDGLLYCARCHTRRQLAIEIPLIGHRIVGTLCKCDQDRRAAEEEARKAYEERERIKRLRKIGITDAAYHSMTFANDDGLDPKMMEIMRRYVANRHKVAAENIGMMLHGETDGGKTYLAACIANALIDHGVSAMITTIPALIGAMQQDFEASRLHVLNQVRNVQFLILDDVGFERRTPYASEKLYEIINARYLAKRPLIVTTNLTLDEIKDPADMDYKRVFSRLIEMTTPVYVSGKERRQKIAREKSASLRDMLNRFDDMAGGDV